MNRCIHSVEWWLGHEACRVIACSDYMRREVTRLLELPDGRVEVVPNGVDSKVWHAPSRAVVAARSRYAGEGPLIGYAGRLVYEKGVQDLIAAMPRLCAAYPGLRAVIAGDGPHRGNLEEEVLRRKLDGALTFTGFVGEGELAALIAAMDALVIPSIYEPFGLVALEGASTGTPLAVAATGGLAEFVQPGVTGVTFPAKSPDALADAVSVLLADKIAAGRLAKRARAVVNSQYGWDSVAGRTARIYATAVRDEPRFAARRDAAAMQHGRPTIAVPDGNLLEGAMS
jgi:glycogen(starch) synthase